jgi:hypothetical protein
MANKGIEAEKYLEFLVREQENILSQKPTSSFSGPLSPEVKKCCDAVMGKFMTGGKLGDISLTKFTLQDYKNTKKVLGRNKADFIITNGTNTYSTSLKFGDAYQLSSAGVSKSTEIFYNAINDAFTSSGDVNSAYQNASLITPYILNIDKQLSGLKTTTKQNIASALNRYVNAPKSSGSLIKQVFNNKTSTMVDFYYEMKLNIVEEILTGKETTQANHAEYILNLISPTNIIFKKIDKSYVQEVADRTRLRISPKSRSGGMQEISFRFE